MAENINLGSVRFKYEDFTPEQLASLIQGAVVYNAPLNLTDEEKNTAKTNIGIEEVINPFKGKTISFLGDSITSFENETVRNINFYPNGDVLTVGDTYWKQVIDELELTLVANASIAGGAITGDRGVEIPGVLKDKTYTDLIKDGVKPDIVVINIGSSDFNNIKPPILGDYTGTSGLPDSTSEEYNLAFREGYITMLMKIRSLLPQAQIYCCTMLDSSNVFPQMNTNTINEVEESVYYITEYNQAIRDIATAFNCPVVPFDLMGINALNITTFTTDNTHPNKLGMKLLANKLKESMLYGSLSTGMIGVLTERNIVHVGGESSKHLISQAGLASILLGYVLKKDGYGLSQANFTPEEKEKLGLLYNYQDANIKASITNLDTIKANKADVYDKEQVDAKLASALEFAGSVASYDLLPTDASVGDVYCVEAAYESYPAFTNFAFDKSGNWDPLGGVFDLTNYATKADITALEEKLNTAIGLKLDSDKLILVDTLADYEALSAEDKANKIVNIKEV